MSFKKSKELFCSLERKIKAINALGGETSKVTNKDFQEPLPGTNMFTARGDNPIWNPDEEQKPQNTKANPVYKTNEMEFDSDESSSDDEFVGVEDQDDFKGFKERYDDSTSTGSSAVSEGPGALYFNPYEGSGRVKGNPLFDESEL